jgi:hypothetical protein
MGDDMSDRVAIIGGGTSGRDHFSWPAQDSTPWDGTTAFPFPVGVGTGTNYPGKVSLAVTAKWLLRVKKWRVTIPAFHDGNDDADYSGFTFDTLPFYNSFSGGATEITTESELVLSNFANIGGVEDWTMDQGQQWGGDASIGINDGLNGAGLFFESGQFYLDISFRIRGFVGDPTEDAPGDLEDHGHLIIISDRSSTGFPADWSSCGSLVIDSTLTVTLFKHHAGTTLSGNITLDPLEYWPYSARDSSPIYNTSTGAQLQDPLADYDVGQIDEIITQAIIGVPSTLVVHRNPSPWTAV